MRNVVGRRFDEYKILKPEVYEIEYEQNTETIDCRDWGINND